MTAANTFKDSEATKDGVVVTTNDLTMVQKSEIVLKNLRTIVTLQTDAELLLGSINTNLKKMIVKKDQIVQIIDEMDQCAQENPIKNEYD